MSRPRAFTLVELLMVIVIIGLLMALLLPALGIARRTARQRENDTHVRGVHQAMVSFAEGNRGFFPGVRSNNTLVGQGAGDADIDSASGQGGRLGSEVTVRHEILFDGGYITGDFAISPEEDKTEWTSGEVTQDHYSYAMLRIYYRGSSGGFAPRDFTLNEEWRNTLNSKAVVITDRNVNETTPPGNSGAPGNAWSIHTGPPVPPPTCTDCEWHGSVGYNDGRVEFASTQEFDLKYGRNPLIQDDNLFQDNDGSQGNNALLVYER